MKYIITGIKDCHFVFNHKPAVAAGHFGAASPEKYEGEIELELVMYQGLAETPSRKVTKTIFSFLHPVPNNVVIEESKEKVAIHLPIAFFEGFYKLLREDLSETRNKITMETEGKANMTFAKFHFTIR